QQPTPPAADENQQQLSPELAEAAARVQAAIAEVKAAQASGDFERYGRALKALDEAMTAFQAASGSGPAPSPTASASPSPGEGSPPSPSGSPPG
ncbi:MAG: hypothetical protein DIU79_10920, partial [Actinobacteria bacterium]